MRPVRALTGVQMVEELDPMKECLSWRSIRTKLELKRKIKAWFPITKTVKIKRSLLRYREWDKLEVILRRKLPICRTAKPQLSTSFQPEMVVKSTSPNKTKMSKTNLTPRAWIHMRLQSNKSTRRISLSLVMQPQGIPAKSTARTMDQSTTFKTATMRFNPITASIPSRAPSTRWT